MKSDIEKAIDAASKKLAFKSVKQQNSILE
jgi:hypothetical protein